MLQNTHTAQTSADKPKRTTYSRVSSGDPTPNFTEPVQNSWGHPTPAVQLERRLSECHEAASRRKPHTFILKEDETIRALRRVGLTGESGSSTPATPSSKAAVLKLGWDGGLSRSLHLSRPNPHPPTSAPNLLSVLGVC